MLWYKYDHLLQLSPSLQWCNVSDWGLPYYPKRYHTPNDLSIFPNRQT